MYSRGYSACSRPSFRKNWILRRYLSRNYAVSIPSSNCGDSIVCYCNVIRRGLLRQLIKTSSRPPNVVLLALIVSACLIRPQRRCACGQLHEPVDRGVSRQSNLTFVRRVGVCQGARECVTRLPWAVGSLFLGRLEQRYVQRRRGVEIRAEICLSLLALGTSGDRALPGSRTSLISCAAIEKISRADDRAARMQWK